MSLSKVLYLVRHGAYDHRDPRDPVEGKSLVSEGVLQAERTGEWFARLGTPIDRVVSSDFQRARRTAEILCARLPGIVPEIDPNLREIPVAYHRSGCASVLAPLSEEEGRLHPPGALAAFRDHFARLPEASSREVLVCHENLILHFLSRLLSIPKNEWEFIWVRHCCITEIHVEPDGMSSVESICEADHLPDPE